MIGVVSLPFVSLVSRVTYALFSVYRAFPAMTPNATTADTIIQNMVKAGVVEYGVGVGGGHQAGMQAATLVVSIVLAIVGGILTGQ